MSDEKKEKLMSNDEIRGAVLARIFSAAAQPSELDRLRALDMTLREMARDRYTNPQQLQAPDNTKVANAPQVVTAGSGRGWQEEKPLAAPPGQDAIERLVNAALPHGAGSPLRKGKPKADENK